MYIPVFPIDTRLDSLSGCRFLLLLGDPVGLAYGENGQFGYIGLLSTPKLLDWMSSLGFILDTLSGRQFSDRFLREGTDFNITGSGSEPLRFGSDRVTSWERDLMRWVGGGSGLVGGGSVSLGFISTSTAVCLKLKT